MTIRGLFGRVKRAASAVSGPGDCHCLSAPSGEPWHREPVAVDPDDEDCTLRGRCRRCGGFYRVAIIEEVVEAPT